MELYTSQITFKYTDEDKAKLTQLAASRKTGKGTIAREALQRYLAEIKLSTPSDSTIAS